MNMVLLCRRPSQRFYGRHLLSRSICGINRQEKGDGDGPSDVKSIADDVYDKLLQDGPGFNARTALDEMHLDVTNRLVREVLIRISKSINHANKSRCAKLGLKFFAWAGRQKNYQHSPSTYNKIMKIFADCGEVMPMFRFLFEMTEMGIQSTARTLNILLNSCGGKDEARIVAEWFMNSETFNYRPFKHSYNAILYSLLTTDQYELIEWVYQRMLLVEHTPDTLTYNVVMWAKVRMGKMDEFDRLAKEMYRKGFSRDLHTYNIHLHVLGLEKRPREALELLYLMEEVGCSPSVLHFTSLIDGLSRVGEMDACEHFFKMMVEKGIVPDVVSYTVMILGYIETGQLEKAKELFNDMIEKGQLPNVFTYHSMIRGLCNAQKFDEACSMLKDMQSKGCEPNFLVYCTLARKLRSAKKLSEVDEVVADMLVKGHDIPLYRKSENHENFVRRYKFLRLNLSFSRN